MEGVRKVLQVESTVATKAWDPCPQEQQEQVPPPPLLTPHPPPQVIALWARHRRNISQTPSHLTHSHSRMQTLPSAPFYRWGNCGSERLSDSPKVAQPRARIQIKMTKPKLLVGTLPCFPNSSSLGSPCLTFWRLRGPEIHKGKRPGAGGRPPSC